MPLARLITAEILLAGDCGAERDEGAAFFWIKMVAERVETVYNKLHNGIKSEDEEFAVIAAKLLQAVRALVDRGDDRNEALAAAFSRFFDFTFRTLCSQALSDSDRAPVGRARRDFGRARACRV